MKSKYLIACIIFLLPPLVTTPTVPCPACNGSGKISIEHGLVDAEVLEVKGIITCEGTEFNLKARFTNRLGERVTFLVTAVGFDSKSGRDIVNNTVLIQLEPYEEKVALLRARAEAYVVTPSEVNFKLFLSSESEAIYPCPYCGGSGKTSLIKLLEFRSIKE